MGIEIYLNLQRLTEEYEILNARTPEELHAEMLKEAEINPSDLEWSSTENIMETKYYTPEIEEFHIGFEYSADRSSDKWEADIFTIDSDINGLSEMLNENLIRVKYLDREDIESFRWLFKHFSPFEGKETSSLQRLVFSGSFETRFGLEEFGMIYVPSTSHLLIWRVYDDLQVEAITDGVLVIKQTLFAGTIRNKSELKRIMKMINIA